MAKETAKTNAPEKENTLESDIEKFNKTSEELNIKTKKLAETEIELMEREEAALLAEAKSLGITASKTNFSQAKVKDLDVEQMKQRKLILIRLKNRIEAAKNKGSEEKQRRTLLEARIAHAQDYPIEQIAQAKYELMKMDQKQWKPGMKMPKKKTVYDEIMAS